MATVTVLQVAAGFAMALQGPVANADDFTIAQGPATQPQAIVERVETAPLCADLTASLVSTLDPATGRLVLNAHIVNRGKAAFKGSNAQVAVTLYAVTESNVHSEIGSYEPTPSIRHGSGEGFVLAAHDFVEAGRFATQWGQTSPRPYAFKMAISVTPAANHDAKRSDCRTGNNIDLLTASEIDRMFERAALLAQRNG